MEIKVYTKSDCPFCTKAKNWFDENGFEYETILKPKSIGKDNFFINISIMYSLKSANINSPSLINKII